MPGRSWPGGSSGGTWALRWHLAPALHGGQLMLRCEVRIPDRHLQRLVPEQLLHGSQINPGHHESARKRVPEAVPREIGHLRFRNRGLKPVPRPEESLPVLG